MAWLTARNQFRQSSQDAGAGQNNQSTDEQMPKAATIVPAMAVGSTGGYPKMGDLYKPWRSKEPQSSAVNEVDPTVHIKVGEIL